MEEVLPQMKVLFLDFDGVLNGDAYVRRQGRFGVILDPEKLHLLKTIVAATGARIVLSTSWREHWEKDLAKCDSTGALINSIFSKHGLQIWDKTPQLRTKRETQIKSWLDRHPEVKNFVVLDDSLLSADYLNGHFIKTSNYFDGLDETDVQKAMDILNR
jgi:hypothetical protein